MAMEVSAFWSHFLIALSDRLVKFYDLWNTDGESPTCSSSQFLSALKLNPWYRSSIRVTSVTYFSSGRTNGALGSDSLVNLEYWIQIVGPYYHKGQFFNCLPGDEWEIGRIEEFAARVLDAEVRVHRIAAADVSGDHEAALARERIEVPQRLEVIPAWRRKSSC